MDSPGEGRAGYPRVTGIVVDASVVVDALISAGERGKRSRDLLRGNCFVPELVFSEISSALVRWERHTGSGAGDLVASVLEFGWTAVSYRQWGAGLWELRHDLSPYDAAYVALARVLGVPLVTHDQKLARTARRYCDIITPD